jgi:hypothetical protein
MKKFRFGLIALGICAAGGTFLISQSFAGQSKTPVLEVVRHSGRKNVSSQTRYNTLARVSPSIVPADHKIKLVPPPSELPDIRSRSMVTSITPTAAIPVKASKVAAPVAKSNMRKTTEVRVASAISRPSNIYSYSRLINYAPHPLSEDLLKRTPLSLMGKNYWFSVRYDEDWKVINDDEAYIRGISFEIDVMEGNNKVRSMKTPKVSIDPKKIKKGQVLGIAEVAPYKFTIKVEEFEKKRKGISELVFKLDLVG